MDPTGAKTNQIATEGPVPPPRVNWKWLIFLTFLHLGTIGCVFGIFLVHWKWRTVLFHVALGYTGGFGTTIGAHRYFAHRSFKAVRPLGIFLALCHTLAFQESVYQWVKWHRTHHKHSDTEMDPHNAARGFFYSHIGWIAFLNWERSEFQTKSVVVADLEADPFIMWQHRNYYPFAIFLTIVAPLLVTCLVFEETLLVAVIATCIRLTLSYNITFLVNSAAHLWGYRPYGKDIYPRENPLVSWLALGEGWHNYHHTFPWDYRASEFGPFYQINPSAGIINLFAALGWVYDLKTASPKLINERVKRTGDGSRLHMEEKTVEGQRGYEDNHNDDGVAGELTELLYPRKSKIH